MENNNAQTPLEDLRADALKHYDELSSKATCSVSSIPRAINYYYDNKIHFDLKVETSQGCCYCTKTDTGWSVFVKYNLGYGDDSGTAKIELNVKWAPSMLFQFLHKKMA